MLSQFRYDPHRLTSAAYDAITATLPEGAPLSPVQCQGGQCLTHIEAAVLDRLRATRRPGESYSDVILRLVELELGGSARAPKVGR